MVIGIGILVDIEFLIAIVIAVKELLKEDKPVKESKEIKPERRGKRRKIKEMNHIEVENTNVNDERKKKTFKGKKRRNKAH